MEIEGKIVKISIHYVFWKPRGSITLPRPPTPGSSPSPEPPQPPDTQTEHIQFSVLPESEPRQQPTVLLLTINKSDKSWNDGSNMFNLILNSYEKDWRVTVEYEPTSLLFGGTNNYVTQITVQK